MWFRKTHPHEKLSLLRAAAYRKLFEDGPVRVYPYTDFTRADDEIRVDVYLYALKDENGRDIVAAVTNGMSDRRMVDPKNPSYYGRREVIQYLAECKPADAHRLHGIAYVALAQGFFLDFQHTLELPWEGAKALRWRNSIFLWSLLNPHREFSLDLEDDTVELLWHVPLSDQELAYQQMQGLGALLDRMQEAKLPWVFEASNRPALVP